jgi:hypothetical protein
MSGDVASARASAEWVHFATALQKPFSAAELDAALREAMAEATPSSARHAGSPAATPPH